MGKPIITVIMPCFRRLEQTKRAIESILNQDIGNWEAIIMGDNCPEFERLINSGYLEGCKRRAEKNNCLFTYFNSKVRSGYYGRELLNKAYRIMKGKYFVFLNNDDIILPNHFRHYLSEIHQTRLDLVYYNTKIFSRYVPIHGWCKILSYDRETRFTRSQIGHCDLIIKSSFIKKHNFQLGKNIVNGLDWELANFVKLKNGRIKKAESVYSSYIIRPVDGYTENFDTMEDEFFEVAELPPLKDTQYVWDDWQGEFIDSRLYVKQDGNPINYSVISMATARPMARNNGLLITKSHQKRQQAIDYGAESSAGAYKRMVKVSTEEILKKQKVFKEYLKGLHRQGFKDIKYKFSHEVGDFIVVSKTRKT